MRAVKVAPTDSKGRADYAAAGIVGHIIKSRHAGRARRRTVNETSTLAKADEVKEKLPSTVVLEQTPTCSSQSNGAAE